MNESWFGDSYDIVKRFFVDVTKANGYVVYADGMFTGEWTSKPDFFRFLGATDVNGAAVVKPSALFLDPDTGVGTKTSKRHTTLLAIVERLREHDVVFVFDQAFSRALPLRAQAMRKLRRLEEHGAHGFYYNSHARFLFCARSPAKLRSLRKALARTGLPESRIISL